MERLPTPTIDIKDVSTRRFLLDLVKALSNVQESTLHYIEVPWSEPINLAVPLRSGTRKNSPAIVRLARAQLSANPRTPVNFGATHWEWNGDGSVSLIHIDGLALGTSYKLTFEAVG
jgi:hypothetical protein